MRRLAVFVFVGTLGVPLAAGDARAQSAIVGPPRVTWAGAPSDAQGAAGVHAPSSSSILFEPLRLGLLGETFPMDRLEPGCDRHLEAAGTATAATAGAPMQSLFARRLLPGLTLFGMSRGGCAVGAAIGAGLTYVVPLAPKIFFVAGFGAIGTPPIPGYRRLDVRPLARVDLVFDRGGGRSWNVGVRANGRTSGVSFGGIF